MLLSLIVIYRGVWWREVIDLRCLKAGCGAGVRPCIGGVLTAFSQEGLETVAALVGRGCLLALCREASGCSQT